MKNGKIELNDDELADVSGGDWASIRNDLYICALVCKECGTSIREEESFDIKDGIEKQFCEECDQIQTFCWKCIGTSR